MRARNKFQAHLLLYDRISWHDREIRPTYSRRWLVQTMTTVTWYVWISHQVKEIMYWGMMWIWPGPEMTCTPSTTKLQSTVSTIIMPRTKTAVFRLYMYHPLYVRQKFQCIASCHLSSIVHSVCFHSRRVGGTDTYCRWWGVISASTNLQQDEVIREKESYISETAQLKAPRWITEEEHTSYMPPVACHDLHWKYVSFQYRSLTGQKQALVWPAYWLTQTDNDCDRHIAIKRHRNERGPWCRRLNWTSRK